MAIVTFHIDQKLIHGQILSGWVPYLRVNEIVVVDEDTTLSPLIMGIYASGVPENISTYFISPVQLASHLREEKPTNFHIFVLFKEIAAVTESLLCGTVLKKLSLGSFAHLPGTKCVKITPAFTADESELRQLNSIFNQGIEISAQTLPSEPKININPANISWPWPV